MEDEPQRVDVALRGCRSTREELGRHVWQRTCEEALTGRRRLRLLLDALGQTEVEQFHLSSFGDEGVCRLEIAVEHPLAMRRREPSGQTKPQAESLPPRYRQGQLREAFLPHARMPLVPPADATALEQLLVHVWEDARAQWLTVTLPAKTFIKHLAERLPAANPESPIEQILAQLSLAELYLACACLQGSAPPAIKLFEEHYLTKLRKLLGHRRQSPEALDEICQLARVKLLVSTPEGPPKIAEYTGKGALMAWVRITAVRIAIKIRASDRSASEEDLDAADLALPAPGVAPELDIIKLRRSALDV